MAELLIAAKEGTVVKAPPQLYELRRLLNFNTISTLREYADIRDKCGTERIFPVHIKCSDGYLRVFPGKWFSSSCLVMHSQKTQTMFVGVVALRYQHYMQR